MEACWALCEAFLCGNPGVRFIHGFHRGTVIQRHLRKPNGLRADVRQKYPELPPLEIEPAGAGMTRILFQREGR